ncbi:protein TALPID3 isoform X3 [Fundulus heteroclitus]|uniref:protein TALPID3 isoform X3 n=1 Tax=Fundulus heteroclitus TaxID=8078 RepID=UPI00165B6FE5|nr:protein TALPID3 isoform X3 [Fundulus heteroclitus]
MLSPAPSDPAALSPGGSSCCSDTGDVLIRSTRIVLPDRRQEDSETPRPVQITVQKLRDPQPNRARGKQGLQKPRPQPEVVGPERTGGDSHTGQELLTSCYKAGGRGVVLGALRQRCHSTHHKREVSVQLLEPRPSPNAPSHQETPDRSADDAAGVSSDRGLQTQGSSSCLGDLSKTAAAAATAAATAAVAAAAPLLKAQSDIEARMSQLSDGIQKVLHTNREGDSRGRSLSQQTLHHLETLQSQQLQLQSQLLESAIRIVRGHDSVTSDSKDAAKMRDQKPSSSGSGGPAITPAAVQMDAVTMETRHSHSRTEQPRGNIYLQDRLADHMTENIHPQSLAHHTQEAVRRAGDMLKQMERLKTEIKMLLTQQKDTPEFPLPSPDYPRIQQSQPEPQQRKSKQKHVYLSNSDPSHPRPSSLQQTDSQNTHPQFEVSPVQHKESRENMQFQHNHPRSQNPRPIQASSQAGPLSTHHSHSQEVRGQSRQWPRANSSMLEEAGQVLRQARRRKKLLEDNLEALLKAKTGEILHCQLEALAANRDLSEDVRIKKTVDAWINTLTRDVQQDHPRPLQGEKPAGKATLGRGANAVKSRPRSPGRGKPTIIPKGVINKPVMGRGSRGQVSGHKMEPEPGRVSGNLMGSQQEDMDGEQYLTRLYGKLPYEGQRRTLKRSPYPRFSSPVSPLGRKQRPRLVESIRGVRLKSCKTQTSFTPLPSLSAGQLSQHYALGPSDLSFHESVQPTANRAKSPTAAMAIPLRLPRMDCSSRGERAQDRASVLPASLSASEVDMNDRANDQQKQLVTEKPPSSPSRVIKIIAAEPLKENEDEENTFPGNNFLSVTDVHQEEKSEVGEEAVVLEGSPSPAPVQYHSPAFPPEVPSSRCDDIVNPGMARSQPHDMLENRLVEWVEQQLMSRMIADMYRPPLSDPAQNESTDQSELEERSLTSDIVETAGGGGLQLFVDSNVSVDSALIRQLVNEVLTETVAQMLCRTNATDPAPEPGLEEPKSEPGEDKEENLAPLVPTPAQTPQPGVAQLSRETTPAATPPPSKPSSPVTQGSPQPITAPEPVATPTTTPEPHGPEESPPGVHQAPPPPIYGDPELPLDEENSEEQLESQKHPLVMSTEKEEPPVSSPPLPPPAQPEPPLARPDPALPPSLSEATSSSSSSISSSPSRSSTVTAETEGALKHISEGELLIPVNQLAPLTEEEGVYSFSSSLHEVEDMTFDSSTVEQVGGRDLLLTLLTKMNQGVSHGGQRPQPEGSWGREELEDEVSVGEVGDYGHAKPQGQNKNLSRQDEISACGRTSQPAEVGQQDKQNMQEGDGNTAVYLPIFRAQGDRNEEDVKETGESVNANTDSSTSDFF